MNYQSSTFVSPADGIVLGTYAWDAVSEPHALVQIAHGLAEHAGRYDRLASALNGAGYLVRAADHRGHGRSIVGTPGDFGEAGFDGLIDDVASYGAHIRAEHAHLPLFLIGHSMGSFAAQAVVLEHSEQYDGVVLSGSTALDVIVAGMGESESEAPAGLEMFNAGFEHRTGYEWLSRDEAEVDAYVADPLCGFDLPEDTMAKLFAPAARLANPIGIRPDLPLLVTSGSADPLAGGGELVQLLGQRYRDAGVEDVTVKIYDDARHEIFNELNRDEVTHDVIDWLDRHR